MIGGFANEDNDSKERSPMMIKVLKIISGLILYFNVLALIWVGLYGLIPIPTTKLMIIEDQQKEINYQWKPLDEITDKLALAIMCSEDQNFILHNGLDFYAIQQAEDANRKGRSLRGASTITQQVAKNVFLWPDRSWTRKAAELYFALLIDAIWSKERIMEVYLNVVELVMEFLEQRQPLSIISANLPPI